MSDTAQRAIVGARVSVVRGPEKVSHQAQHQTGAKWAADNNCTVVGTFEDLDVSAGAFDPWQRPDLGEWLKEERVHEWDVVIWSKIDRAFRSIRDAVKFAEWARERRKVVVFAEDGLKLDYTKPADSMTFDAMLAELFVYLGAFFGQMELNRFRSRSLDFHRVLRTTDRWAGGVPPLGFKPVPHPSGKGIGVATDPEAKDLLHDMAAKLIGGWSYTALAEWLNETGALSAKARDRVRRGQEAYPPRKSKDGSLKAPSGPWTVNRVIRALTKPGVQGWKVDANDRPVLDERGNMIRLAPPTFDDETWEQIQHAAAARRTSGKRRVHSSNPVLGIGVCGLCGASLSQQYSPSRTDKYAYRRYRCARTPKSCKGVHIDAGQLDQLLENTFLLAEGDHKVRERVFVPGTDNRTEIETLRASLRRLRAESDAGLVDDEEEWLQRLSGLTQRLRDLEPEPYRASTWDVRQGVQTYREVWHEADPAGKRKLLQDAGTQVRLFPDDRVELDLEWGRQPSVTVAGV